MITQAKALEHVEAAVGDELERLISLHFSSVAGEPKKDHVPEFVRGLRLLVASEMNVTEAIKSVIRN